jgi:glycosyltransferase involved in cell wall biosynthesis
MTKDIHATRPLFTIVTVTYNAADTLAPTLKSINAQTCRLFEHIIQDGASTDATLEIARELGGDTTRIYSSPDRGLYDAMNKAMGEAHGDYLIFLNAGDRFHSPDTLEAIARAIADNDYPAIVYGDTNLVDSDGTYLGERHLSAPETLTLDSFKHGMLVCHQAFVVLRRIAPLYNVSYRYSADYEWCIRCLQHAHRTVNMHRVTIDYLHEGLTTRNRRRSLGERFDIMSRYYGLLPTIGRHLGFAMRFAKRRQVEKTMYSKQKSAKQ